MPNAVKLRNPNFESIEVTLGATKDAGAMDLIEDTVGIYVNGGESGDKDAFIHKCEKVVVPKATGASTDFAAGDKVYFDNTAKAVTYDPTGNTLCGRANEAVLTTDTEVEINLVGNVAG